MENMILEIKQTASSGINRFDISSHGTLLYRADSSWLPGITENARKLHLTDTEGSLVYEARYSVLENIAESGIPLKYLVTGSQKFAGFEVIGQEGEHVGNFYVEINGIADRKICLEHDGRVLIGYKRKLGDREAVSFYEEDMQVGQLTKSNRVSNNLDNYMLHFLDGFDQWKPILACFVIYYDFLYHGHAGEYRKGYTVKYTYSFDRNNEKYQDDFIRDNFGEEELKRMEAFFKVKPMVGSMSLKTFWIIFAAGWGIALAVAAIVLIIVFVL